MGHGKDAGFLSLLRQSVGQGKEDLAHVHGVGCEVAKDAPG